MGKANSKESVDITTEPSREIQEGSGKLKKLDDAYFKENESSDKENKVVNDAAENEKNESVKVEEGTASQAETPAAAPETEENKIEEPSSEDKATEEIKDATAEPDSAAKPKKEKVRRRWSFKSMSFGKKDKQKPSKKDKKNEDNKAVAEGTEEKVEVGVEIVDEKPQDTKAEATESKPLEPVVETVVTEVKEEAKPVKKVKLEAASVSEPVQAVVEAVKAKTPEPIIIVAPAQEIKVEEPVAVEAPALIEEVKVVKEEKNVEEQSSAVIEEIPAPAPTPVEEKTVEIPEIIAHPIVEEPPAIPASPPPSQFSVFAESMNVQTIEENLPVPAEVVDVIVENVNGEEQEIDVEPVAEMIEKVLEQAVDRVQSEINEKADDDELPPPPAEEIVETQPATEVIVEVTQNGVGEHVDDEQVETVKLENGVHNGDVINESEPIVGELKKEDKVSDKIAQDSPLAPEIITE